MVIKNYDFLPDGAKYVRKKVFVEEQGFKEEFDSVDGVSTHFVAFDGENPVGTIRFYRDGQSGNYIFGRLAVLKEYRGSGLGRRLVDEVERLIKEDGGSSVLLHAQCRAAGFYSHLGYKEFGEVDYDEYCPHIWMKKNL